MTPHPKVWKTNPKGARCTRSNAHVSTVQTHGEPSGSWKNSQVSGELFVCRNNFSGTGPGRQEAGTGSKEIPGCGKIVAVAKQFFLTETISFSIIGVQVVSKIVE